MKKTNVAILGASDHHHRYSYKANSLLTEKGFKTFLVNPKYDLIDEQRCYRSLSELDQIDTITVYVSAVHSTPLVEDIIKLHPRRVIFNPGSENYEIYKQLQNNN